MEDLKDNITVTRVESYPEDENKENKRLFIKLDKANGFEHGDQVIVLRYQDFSNMMDVSTVSELRRKLESYANSFMRVKELKMKLESAEIYYKEQLNDIKAHYNHQIAKLTSKI